MICKQKKYIFYSPHSIEECRCRLKDSVETSFFTLFSSKRVAGKISNNSINLRKIIYYRNSFQRILRGTLNQTSNGTEIVATIGLHPFVKIFILIWLGGIIAFCGISIVIPLVSNFKENYHTNTHSIMFILFTFGIGLFGIFLVKIGSYVSRKETIFLKEFIIELLDCEEIKIVEPEN